MKIQIKLTLHRYDQFLLLDSQDCYQYIGENTEKEVELAHYIEMFCESKNYSLLKNPEMAFDDGKEFQLNGWVDGYNYAKHHKIDEKNHTIEGSWYKISYEEPFAY